MKILSLYGTTEGQTRKVSEFIANKLRSYGDVVTILDATTLPEDLDLRDYHGAIIAASIHASQYQTPIVHFAKANHVWLNQMPSAFISVSLSAAGTELDELTAIASCAENFKLETGWSTADVHHVAGAFRFAEYDYFKRWVMKLIAWEKAVKVEPGKDFELTNWEALSVSVDTLRARFADKTTQKANQEGQKV